MGLTRLSWSVLGIVTVERSTGVLKSTPDVCLIPQSLGSYTATGELGTYELSSIGRESISIGNQHRASWSTHAKIGQALHRIFGKAYLLSKVSK